MDSSQQFTNVLHDWVEAFMHRSMRDMVSFSKQSGLSVGQLSTLFHLYHGKACGVSDIGERLGITSAAASQMVDRLVQQGVLERTEDPHDRRVKQIRLTPKGQELVQASIAARQRWMEELTQALTPSELAETTRSLVLLTQAALKLNEG